MVAYELSVIMKLMPRHNLVQAVKRTAEIITSQRGLIEKVEFLGTRNLPYRISKFGENHGKGSYFMIHFHAPYVSAPVVKDNCQRDVDIIRNKLVSKEIPVVTPCTLHEETIPPAYRADVQKMTEEANKRLPINIKMRTKQRKELENYKF